MTAPLRSEDPGEYLARLMRRAGANSNSISLATNREVSATTIRTYVKGGKATSSKLAAIARALGEPAGSSLLRAYGFEDLADAVAGGTDDDSVDRELPGLRQRSDMERIGDTDPSLSLEGRQLVAAFVTWLRAIEDRRTDR